MFNLKPKRRISSVKCIMYLVVEGQSRQVAVGRLERTEICVGKECEYVEDELVIQAFEQVGPRGRNGRQGRGC